MGCTPCTGPDAVHESELISMAPLGARIAMLLPFVWMTGMHMSPEHVEGVPAVVAATAARSAAVRVDRSAVWLRTVSRRPPTCVPV